MMTARFTGLPEEALDFLEALEFNNNRPWFQEHKGDYEKYCKGPMEALVGELEQTFGPSKMFRIYRDVRFSKDKTPYKTSLTARVGDFYLSITTEQMYAGGGFYRPESAYMKKFRNAVAAEGSGKELEKVLSGLRRKKFDVSTHDMLKRPPRGFDAEHPRIELLKHKDLHAGRSFKPAAWWDSREFLNRIKKVYADLKPFQVWLAKHVG